MSTDVIEDALRIFCPQKEEEKESRGGQELPLRSGKDHIRDSELGGN